MTGEGVAEGVEAVGFHPIDGWKTISDAKHGSPKAGLSPLRNQAAIARDGWFLGSKNLTYEI
jgi:hypothetical protein